MPKSTVWDDVGSSFGGVGQHFVEALGGDGDVVHTSTFLGQEACVDALVIARLDQFPLELSDHRNRHAPGTPGGPAEVVKILRVIGVEFGDLPRTP